MGTTLVVAVLHRGVLYVANIGDSRAYLLRDGTIRQVTLDHSWVAEQVRAGVLTEEQARTHVHRNVITRSLGTQPEVVADLFIEQLHDGDILLLCSDGLHGYVDDQSIAETAQQLEPDEAAHRLVEMANDVGGPDNITVTIVHVQETPEPTTESIERLGLNGHSGTPTAPISSTITRKRDISNEVIPLIQKEPVDDASLPAAPGGRRARAISITLVAGILLLLFSGAAWALTLGPFTSGHYTSARVMEDLNRTRQDIASLSSLSPQNQLDRLGADQQRLMSDLTLADLTGDERAQLHAALDNQLTPAARTALNAYYAEALITPLTQLSTDNIVIQCDQNLEAPLVLLSTPSTPAGSTPVASTFARDALGHVRPLTIANGVATCEPALGTNLSVLDMVADGDHLDVLVAGTTSNAPSVAALQTNGTLTPLTTVTQFDPTQRPVALAVAAGYLAVLGSGANGSGDTIYLAQAPKYDTFKQLAALATQSSTIRSMAIGANGLLYLLLGNGAIDTYQLVDGTLHIVGGLDVLPGLPIGAPADFTSATPLPTDISFSDPSANDDRAMFDSSLLAQITHGANKALDTPTPTATPVPTATPTPLPIMSASTLFTTATNLSIDTAATLPHLLIVDSQGHRLVLVQSNGGTDLTFVQQFTDPAEFAQVQATAFAPDQSSLWLLTPTSLINVTLP